MSKPMKRIVDHEVLARVFAHAFIINKVWYDDRTDQMHFRARLPYEGKYADVAASMEVLENADARVAIYDQIMKVLSPVDARGNLLQPS